MQDRKKERRFVVEAVGSEAEALHKSLLQLDNLCFLHDVRAEILGVPRGNPEKDSGVYFRVKVTGPPQDSVGGVMIIDTFEIPEVVLERIDTFISDHLENVTTF